MQYGIVEIFTLLGSLGLFLFGMKIMSEGLQKVSGDKMRTILSAMTGNRFFGVLTGIIITALVQSSSATTLMTVSFVNAGLLSLAQSISVVMGANIGTTVTAWIISLLGFKVDIVAFAIPLITFTLPLLFSKKSKLNSWGEFIMGFALLFLGLQFLKNSVPDLQNSPEALAFLQRYSDMGFTSVLIFLLVGTILTIILQSSSATVAITLIMSSKGWIPFELAIAMVLGENIGTTITANLGALGANLNAKRTAFSHFLFNVFGVIWALCLFYPLVSLAANLTDTFAGDPRDLYRYLHSYAEIYTPTEMSIITGDTITTNPSLATLQSEVASMMAVVSMGIALFHTCFNIINTSIMIWLVPLYVRLCEKLIHPHMKRMKDEKSDSHLQYISYRMISMGELSLLQAHKEMTVYGRRTKEMLFMADQMLDTVDDQQFMELFNRAEKFENICDRIEVEIVTFLTQLSDGHLGAESKEEVRSLMRCATEIESIGDSAFSMARAQERCRRSKVEFTEEQKEQIHQIIALTDKAITRMIDVLALNSPKPSDVHESYNIENEIDNLRDQLRAKNMTDLDEKKYTYMAAVHYIDIIEEAEKLGDYALNAVQAVTDKKA